MENEILQGWVFHFNPYNKIWNAIPREHYLDYWSGDNDDKIIKSHSIDTLIEIILKTNGDNKLIKKLIKN